MARDAVASHFSGSVPVSIAVHLVVLLLILFVPLAADITLPPLVTPSPEYMFAAPLPPPPAFVPARARPAGAAPRAADSVAPVGAPSEVRPESASPAPLIPAQTGVGTELPTGFGVVGSIGIPAPTPPPAKAPPRPSGPIRVAALPEPPRKLVDVRPRYPEFARAARIGGTVVIEAVLDTAGRVTQPRIVHSVAMLDQAALDAVRQWRYSPTVYGGRPVSVLMTITIRFTLDR